MIVDDGSRASPHAKVLLLAGQAFALGLTLAWVTIPASALFLTAYGPRGLPFTYIAAAGAGAAASAALARAFRRRPVALVGARVLGGLTVALAAASALAGGDGADWVSFALLVLVPIIVPVGFIFVVGQAGLLLDVRSLKALYARVVAGFALGVVSGGLAGPILLDLLGDTSDLLVAAAGASALLLGLVILARRLHPAELAVIDHGDAHDVDVDRPTLRSIARNRFVRLIVAFQMLSAVESQWLDFLVFDRAAQRYDDSQALARFVSQFSAIAYGTDIAFLLLFAGLLLRRFGLRYGLTANSLGVLAVVLAMIAMTALQGSGAAIVFALVVAARVVDLTFSDGTSRTSLSAAYQAVPNRRRAVAQATVEGLAVPVAIGCSGVVLLVVEAAGLTDGLTLAVLTALVVLAWFLVALVLYREYGANLLASLRGRTLDPSELAVDDESSLVVVDRLVESADERDVRLGLDILTVAEHPALHLRLEQLAGDAREGVRRDVLERLRQLAPHLAAEAARRALGDGSPEVRAASVRVLGAAGIASDLPAVLAHLQDPSTDVRVAVAFALPRMDAENGTSCVADVIARLAASGDPVERRVAAEMLRECEPGVGVDRSVLPGLLEDPDAAVVAAALLAVQWPHDAALLPAAAEHISDRRTAEAAIDLLVRAGTAALPMVDAGLASRDLDRRAQEQLVRVARDVGGGAAARVLCRHVAHRDLDVGVAVVRALAEVASTVGADGSMPEGVELAILTGDVDHAAHLLRALTALEDETPAWLLRGALLDELDLLRRRVLAVLSIRHGQGPLERVAFQLEQRDTRSHALAVEWLEVTLTAEERPAIALIDLGLSLRDRARRIHRAVPLEEMSTRAVLLEILRDDDARWRPWIKACALEATSTLARGDLPLFVDVASSTIEGAGPESDVLRETIAGFRDRQLDLV